MKRFFSCLLSSCPFFTSAYSGGSHVMAAIFLFHFCFFEYYCSFNQPSFCQFSLFHLFHATVSSPHLQSRWQPCKSELYLACVLQVIDVHDCKSIYRVPLLLANQNIVPLFAKRLQMEIKSPRKPRHFMVQWKELAERCASRLQIFDSSSLWCQILLSLSTGIKHSVEKKKREETIIYWYLGENERLNIQFTGLQKVLFRAFHWIVANSYQHRTNDLLTRSSITNYERTTGELTIWLTIDNCLTVTIDGSKRTNYWLRVLIANNITA